VPPVEPVPMLMNVAADAEAANDAIRAVTNANLMKFFIKMYISFFIENYPVIPTIKNGPPFVLQKLKTYNLKYR